MPIPADRLLRKVTLNLFEEDCQTYERVYGQGWTTKIREVHAVDAAELKTIWPPIKRTLGEL